MYANIIKNRILKIVPFEGTEDEQQLVGAPSPSSRCVSRASPGSSSPP